MSIEIKDLYFKYKTDKFQLNIFEAIFESNSITCLIGPNGSGKTTLLHLLSGLYKPIKGNIQIDGLTYLKNRLVIYSNSYFSVNNPAFYENLNAYRNLKLHCIYRQIPEKRIKEILDIVDLENDQKKYKNFSTGMKQKLNIALALLHEPKLIVLDEPFNGLDPGVIISLKNIFSKINKQYQTTIIISTHLLNEAESFCTHYCILKDGQIIENKKINEDGYIGLENRYIELFNLNKSDK